MKSCLHLQSFDSLCSEYSTKRGEIRQKSSFFLHVFHSDSTDNASIANRRIKGDSMRKFYTFSNTLFCCMTIFERSLVFVKVEIENIVCGAIAGLEEWWCACWWRTDECKGPREDLFISSVRRDTGSSKQTLAERGGRPFKLSVQAERTRLPAWCW